MNKLPTIEISNQDQWKHDVASFISSKIDSILQIQGKCSISLAGGSTPKAVYELLASSEYSGQMEWDNIYFFWGDERCVPHSHDDSNYKMVKEAFLDHVEIPKENIFPVSDQFDPAAAAEDYQQKIEKYFDGKEPSIDIMLLGMGDDGHTASLFPGTNVLSENEKWVSEVFIKDKNVFRISMTAPFINRAKNIVFLIKGENKTPALNQVLNGQQDTDTYPSQLIRRSPNVYYLLDEEAASGV
ncbi:6-phosphogluconolactonase [Membranihabitans maritimus]|uniref:6-phosphogluconolactonase n=1 Tax=Membranihabitans maritimus TaxID=2904244 RepID=UPI001F00E9A1|nr:6-phosphogluconolactonase [Membranihabitans maritimus]